MRRRTETTRYRFRLQREASLDLLLEHAGRLGRRASPVAAFSIRSAITDDASKVKSQASMPTRNQGFVRMKKVPADRTTPH